MGPRRAVQVRGEGDVAHIREAFCLLADVPVQAHDFVDDDDGGPQPLVARRGEHGLERTRRGRDTGRFHAPILRPTGAAGYSPSAARPSETAQPFQVQFFGFGGFGVAVGVAVSVGVGVGVGASFAQPPETPVPVFGVNTLTESPRSDKNS